MGAAGSVKSEINKPYIYISYDISDKYNLYIEILRDELINKNCNVMYSELTSDFLKKFSYNEISTKIKNIIYNTNHFIVCISKETTRSFHQAIEIDNALNEYKEILYLMLDEFYTPLNNRCVKGMVGHNKWFPFYRNKHVFDTVEYILEINL